MKILISLLFLSSIAIGTPPSYNTDSLSVEFTKNQIIVRDDKDVVCFIYELTSSEMKDLLANRDANIKLYSESYIRLIRDNCNVKRVK